MRAVVVRRRQLHCDCLVKCARWLLVRSLMQLSVVVPVASAVRVREWQSIAVG